MLKRFAGILLSSVVTLSFALTPSYVASLQGNGLDQKFMPANEDKIQSTLIANGTIPLGTAPEKAQSIVKTYLQKKLNPNPAVKIQFPSSKDVPHEKALKELQDNERNFKGSNINDNEVKTKVPNAAPLPLSKTRDTGKILVMLVDFAQGNGPMSGQLPKPADPNKDYWVANFDNNHYTKMLFDKTPGSSSLANYYLAQSDGKFMVDGQVYGWIHLPYPEAYYGADNPIGGTDNLNGPAWRIVNDAIKAAGEQGVQIPFKDFDSDGDNYVDSFMIIHAGAGQEGGGGIQGNDAIWSHSWFADNANGGVKTWDGTLVGPYTTEPEDGGVGVFAHEYGHQLGLPDLYDTTYGGESSTGFYTLMSSGSWLGKPLGTQPANLDIWSKMTLGWTPNLLTIDQSAKENKDFLIHSTETYATFAKGFRVNLPQKAVTTNINTPFEGQNEWWSTMGDGLSTTLTRTIDLSSVTNATLNFKTWYDTEYNYDFGYVEVSADNGATFTRIAGNITRDISGIPSIDGTSNGWVDAIFDLSAYAGKSIQLRFHYLTDGGVAQKGWAIDAISIPEIGFTDSAEVSPNCWTLDGFRQFAGTETVNKGQYYLGELVRPYATNAGLNWAYNYYGTPTTMERLTYEPGVLLWYRDTSMMDNNVGDHPGQGRLLLVDAHSTPMMQSTNVAFRTRLQIFDAPFGVKPTAPLMIHDTTGAKFNFPASAPVSVFNDSKSYYNENAPFNSVKTPTYGVKMTVKGVSSDGSAARIGVDFK